MSWQIFKNNMIAFSSNPNAIPSISAVAEKYAIEYDACIKRGGIKYLNPIPLTAAPNLKWMKDYFEIALEIGLSTKTPYNLVYGMGIGVLLYWGGASLATLAPSVPAVGTVVNIAGNTNYISEVGQWSVVPPTLPTKDYALIIDSFILAAQLHLTTIKGVINTTSLSIALGTPVPGLVYWTGYTIEPSDRSTVSNVINKVQNIDANFTKEEIEVLKTEIQVRKEVDSANLSPEEQERQALAEMLDEELKTSTKTSVSLPLTKDEQKELEIKAPPECRCTAGESIVRSARKDVGLVETGATERRNGKLVYPQGLNMGGQENPNINKFNELPTPKDRNGNYIYTAGRIDEMVDAVYGAGTNKGYFVGTGLGVEWCGCAVAAWWTSANQQLPPGKLPGWVPAWKSWALQNKVWVSAEAAPPFPNSKPKPKLGAAIIYTKAAGADPISSDGKANHYHIGIVSGIIELPNGKWTISTIEGNTGGPLGALLGRGICCDEKTPKNTVAGFVNPIGCR